MMEKWPFPPRAEVKRDGGESGLQAIQAMAVLLPALVFFGTAFWALWRPSTVRPSACLSEAALYFGFAGLLNQAYPWFSLGYLARTTTLVLYTFAGLARVFLAVRMSHAVKDLLPHTTLDWVRIIAGVVMLVLIPGMATDHPRGEVLATQSPVSQGVWYVGQGGGSALVNHHYSVPEQRYSLDLVRLDQAGRSCSGSPSSLESYVAWGTPVLAPISGLVIGAVDGLPDMDSGQRDQQNPAGNHVVIETSEGARILLCHLRRGSVAVREGSRVDVGEVVGEVGNSGNTSQPHLHIQAMRRSDEGAWVGIPLEMCGAILHRGQLIRTGE